MREAIVPVVIAHTSPLRTEDVAAVAAGAQVALAADTRTLLAARRSEIESFIQRSAVPAYGFNRGFGHNVDVPVQPSELIALQRSLIRSHSAGVGPFARPRVVRAAMLLRAQSLARGHSGVRPEVVEALIAFLNAGIIPAVPEYGSVGASGDLAPLSHIALALMGEGSCLIDNQEVPTAELLTKHGIKPLSLQMKEGLALNNGVQFSNALAILAAHEAQLLLRTATLATALSCQVMLGSDAPYGAELMALRPHPGAQVVAGWLRNLMHGSPLREAHRSFEVDGEIQDPYSLRCAPQVLGTCYELIQEAREVFEREANSVTDNPLLLKNSADLGRYTEIVSGGHFHGMPVAVRLYSLVQALCIMARLSHTRVQRYVDQARNKGLGSDLLWPALTPEQRSVSSGMMIPEYVAAALTNQLWGLAMPSHLFSLSTDAGQEDHVSMSATLAVRVQEMICRLSEVLAIELAFAHQAAAIRRQQNSIPSKQSVDTLPPHLQQEVRALELRAAQELQRSGKNITPQVSVGFAVQIPADKRALSVSSERALEVIRGYFPTVEQDRELSSQLRALSAAVLRGEVTAVIPDTMWD